MNRFTWLIPSLLLVQGCVTTGSSGPRYADAPKPPRSDELATVYLAYMGGPNAGMSFYVDQRELFSAGPVSYTWVQLPPGRHQFRAQVGFMQMDLAAPSDSTYNQPATAAIDTRAGETYYLEFSTDGEMTRTDEHFILGVGIVGPEYTERGKTLTQVDAEVGQWNLRQMHYVEPRLTTMRNK